MALKYEVDAAWTYGVITECPLLTMEGSHFQPVAKPQLPVCPAAAGCLEMLEVVDLHKAGQPQVGDH